MVSFLSIIDNIVNRYNIVSFLFSVIIIVVLVLLAHNSIIINQDSVSLIFNFSTIVLGFELACVALLVGLKNERVLEVISKDRLNVKIFHIYFNSIFSLFFSAILCIVYTIFDFRETVFIILFSFVLGLCYTSIGLYLTKLVILKIIKDR